MKSRRVWSIVLVVLVTLFGLGRRATQAAEPSLGRSDKLEITTVLSGGEKIPVSHSSPTGPNLVVPPDPNADRTWAMKMVVVFIGLGAGCILLSYLLIRAGGVKRRQPRLTEPGSGVGANS